MPEENTPCGGEPTGSASKVKDTLPPAHALVLNRASPRQAGTTREDLILIPRILRIAIMWAFTESGEV